MISPVIIIILILLACGGGFVAYLFLRKPSNSIKIGGAYNIYALQLGDYGLKVNERSTSTGIPCMSTIAESEQVILKNTLSPSEPIPPGVYSIFSKKDPELILLYSDIKKALYWGKIGDANPNLKVQIVYLQQGIANKVQHALVTITGDPQFKIEYNSDTRCAQLIPAKLGEVNADEILVLGVKKISDK